MFSKSSIFKPALSIALLLALASPAQAGFVWDFKDTDSKNAAQALKTKSLSVDITISKNSAELSWTAVLRNNGQQSLSGTLGLDVDARKLQKILAQTGLSHARLIKGQAAKAARQALMKRYGASASSLSAHYGQGLLLADFADFKAQSERTVTVCYRLKLDSQTSLEDLAINFCQHGARGAQATQSLTLRFCDKAWSSPAQPHFVNGSGLSLEAASALGLFSAQAVPATTVRGLKAVSQRSWTRRAGLKSDVVLALLARRSGLSLALQNTKQPAQSGYFRAILSPDPSWTSQDQAKDVVFVFDTSLSMLMQRNKIKQARKAFDLCIDQLNPGDRFNLITFARSAKAFKSKLVTANDAQRSSAKAFMLAAKLHGGTDIREAVLLALSMKPEKSQRPFLVVFLTDGVQTVDGWDSRQVEKDILKVVGTPKHKGSKIYSIGIGPEVDTHLLDAISQGTGADREYILPGENITKKLHQFFQSFAHPVLTDCQLKFDGVWVKDLFPKGRLDLVRGRSLELVGRYKGRGPARVTITGRRGGKQLTWTLKTHFEAENARFDFLGPRWAQAKLSYLLDQRRLTGQSADLDSEILALAKRYGLPTPTISYLQALASKQAKGQEKTAKQPATYPRVIDQLFDELAKRQFQGSDGQWNNPIGLRAIERSLIARRLQNGHLSYQGCNTDPSFEARRCWADGSAFYSDQSSWIESSLSASTPVTRRIVYLSDEYFEFLNNHSELTHALSLGASVKFRWGQDVIEITPNKR